MSLNKKLHFNLRVQFLIEKLLLETHFRLATKFGVSTSQLIGYSNGLCETGFDIAYSHDLGLRFCLNSNKTYFKQ